MNTFICVARLTNDVQTGNTQNGTYAKFGIAVPRKFTSEGQPKADFFNCVAFGKTGNFVSKYFAKGNRIALRGRIQNDSYTNKDGIKVTAVSVVVDEAYFCDSKNERTAAAPAETFTATTNPATVRTSDSTPAPAHATAPAPSKPSADDFVPIPDSMSEELPFV